MMKVKLFRVDGSPRLIYAMVPSPWTQPVGGPPVTRTEAIRAALAADGEDWTLWDIGTNWTRQPDLDGTMCDVYPLTLRRRS